MDNQKVHDLVPRALRDTPRSRPAIEVDSTNRSNPLEALQLSMLEDIRDVNAMIIKRMDSQSPLVGSVAGYLINSGGKRLRPLLMLGSSRLCGYQGRRAIKIAAAIEFIHSATLLHDDVVDESDLRRGQKTANVVWGNQASVLVGDFLFSRAFQLMEEDGSLDCIRVLTKASATLSEGEVMQLALKSNLEATKEDYLKVILAKTAELFSAACELGAMLAELAPDKREAMRLFGENLGIAFQLTDDALDYSSSQSKLGKNVGDDFREGKITLPVILAYSQGDQAERAFWYRTMHGLDQEEGDFPKAQSLLSKHDTLTQTLDLARYHAGEAQKNIECFKGNSLYQIFHRLCNFCVERQY